MDFLLTDAKNKTHTAASHGSEIRGIIAFIPSRTKGGLLGQGGGMCSMSAPDFKVH